MAGRVSEDILVFFLAWPTVQFYEKDRRGVSFYHFVLNDKDVVRD
jgi:hypothetical protein